MGLGYGDGGKIVARRLVVPQNRDNGFGTINMHIRISIDRSPVVSPVFSQGAFTEDTNLRSLYEEENAIERAVISLSI
jgi:hypothetical protein